MKYPALMRATTVRVCPVMKRNGERLCFVCPPLHLYSERPAQKDGEALTVAINIPADLLNKLAAQLNEQLAGSALPPSEEMEKILRALLQSAVSRLDLVNRSEFDAQCKVLARTRERLEQAEQQLAVLQTSKN